MSRSLALPHLLSPLLLLAVAASAAAADWPEFRGPTADGIVPAEADGSNALPTTWSESAGVAWKTPVPGEGLSTPVVIGGKVWLTHANHEGTRLSVMAIDEASGKVLHERLLVTVDNPEPLANKINTYASCSPAAEEGRVYIHFGSYGTFCLDTENASTLWQRRDLRASHWRGPASSVLLWQQLVILTFDGADQQYLMALDKATGRTVWRRDRSTNFDDLDAKGRPTNSGDLRKAYSTPIVIDVEGSPQLISSAAKACWAYDPVTGAEIWSVHYPTHSPSSRPVYSAELGLLFINTGLGKPQLWAIRIGKDLKGELGDDAFAWKLIKRAPPRSSPVLVNGLLFMAAGSVGTCVDAETGDPIWSNRVGSEFSASLIAQGDRVYWFDEDGQGLVLEATNEYKEITSNRLDEGLGASPAAANGALFLRTQGHLYKVVGE